jgi:spectinomycin phosphotransferase
MAGLVSAMETALALRRDAGLDFVVAPVPAVDGAAVRPAGPGHAVAVFPFLDGSAGRWGEPLPAAERAVLTGMLAALHRSAPPASARVAAIGLARRAELDAALRDLGRPWRTGPFGEPARTLLAGASGQIGDALEIFDGLVGAARASS